MEFTNDLTRLAHYTVFKLFGDYKGAATAARKHNMDVDDFHQIALMELWHCTERYENTGKATFEHYAIQSIEYRLLAEMRRKGNPIRIPEEKRKDDEYQYEYQPIDAPAAGDGRTIHDYIADNRNVERTVIRRMELDERMSKLSRRQREILLLRLEGKTEKEVAAELGMTKGTVNQYVAKALKRLNPEGNKQMNYSGKDFNRMMDEGKSPEEIKQTLKLDAVQFRNYKYRYNKRKVTA